MMRMKLVGHSRFEGWYKTQRRKDEIWLSDYDEREKQKMPFMKQFPNSGRTIFCPTCEPCIDSRHTMQNVCMHVRILGARWCRSYGSKQTGHESHSLRSSTRTA